MHKYDKWFSQVIQSDIKQKSIKGGVNTIFGQLSSFGIRLLSLFILARILSPEEFGVVAMVTSISGIVEIIKDLGLSSAIIQKDKIYQSQMTALFWINSTISVLLGLFVAFSGYFMVWLYDEPRVLYIAFVFAIGIFFSGLSMQHNALMKRQMKFKELAFFQIFGSIIATMVGILFGFLGFSYWAIVFMNISGPIIMAIMLWLKCDWRPGRPAYKGVKQFIEFGAGVSGFNIVNYFSRNFDKILIGRVLDAGTLGLYTKSYQLLLLPINQLRNPLNSVAIPSLSSLKSDELKYNTYYRKFIFLLSLISMPIVAFMFVYSYELVYVMLGPKWIEASKIFSILAIASFIQPVASSRGLVMITAGYSTRYFYWGLIYALCAIFSFIIGIKWGVIGLATSYAIMNYLVLHPSLIMSFKRTPIKPKDFYSEISLPALFSILAGGFSYLLKNMLSLEFSNLFILSIGALVYLLIFICLWLVFSKSRYKLFSQRAILNEILKK